MRSSFSDVLDQVVEDRDSCSGAGGSWLRIRVALPYECPPRASAGRSYLASLAAPKSCVLADLDEVVDRLAKDIGEARSRADLKKLRRALAVQCHPDRFDDEEARRYATQIMQCVNQRIDAASRGLLSE